MDSEQAFDQYHQAIYRFAYRLARNAEVAEDVTQECFLALLRAPARFDEARGTMKTYLFSIARNLVLKDTATIGENFPRRKNRSPRAWRFGPWTSRQRWPKQSRLCPRFSRKR